MKSWCGFLADYVFIMTLYTREIIFGMKISVTNWRVITKRSNKKLWSDNFKSVNY